MDLRPKLFAILGAEDYVPMTRDELLQKLRLKGDEQAELNRLIDELLESGELARLKRNRFCIPEDADLVSGKIFFRQSGTATIIPDAEPRTRVAEGYPVRGEDTGVSLHGDRVLARIVQDSGPPRGRRGKGGGQAVKPVPGAKSNLRVIRILQRGSETIVGTLEQGRHYAYVIPDDPRIIQDILVPDPKNTPLKPRPKRGDKVVVKLLEWKQRHLNPAGEIIEVLGKTHEPDAEFKAILHKYNLNPQFPAAVEKEVGNLPDEVRPADIGNRRDLRDVFTFTIDPDDAKDFDDALSIERIDGGKVRIGVHIADVSAYVKPGTPLDKEAQERGNSTYLVGTVIPMLPHKLSNGLCSLVEAEDRLTKSVFLTFNRSAKLIDTEFANTIIRSNKRLTYKQAFAFMTEDDFAVVRATPLPPAHQTGSTGKSLDEISDVEMEKLQRDIRDVWKIAERLRKARFKKGSLDLDMTDVKIYVDEAGFADRLEVQVNDESHQLIEEFALAANEAVAQVMKRENYPCLYRVHEEPDPEKLQELRETMIAYGIDCKNLEKTEGMSALLAKLKTHPQGYSLRIHVLRSLKQANYRASPDGHYGLAKPDYTHFTSPIRRFSDLVVHRIFDGYLFRIKHETAVDNLGIRYDQGRLESLGDHLSVTERNSVDAERESVKTKLLEYFERELTRDPPNVFKAVITEVKNHGMFIELTESSAFGLIHVSTLTDDLYVIDHNTGDALVGRRHKRRFQAGETIEVEVERVDRFKRQVDFRVSGQARKSSGSGGNRRGASKGVRSAGKKSDAGGGGARKFKKQASASTAKQASPAAVKGPKDESAKPDRGRRGGRGRRSGANPNADKSTNAPRQPDEKEKGVVKAISKRGAKRVRNSKYAREKARESTASAPEAVVESQPVKRPASASRRPRSRTRNRRR